MLRIAGGVFLGLLAFRFTWLALPALALLALSGLWLSVAHPGWLALLGVLLVLAGSRRLANRGHRRD